MAQHNGGHDKGAKAVRDEVTAIVFPRPTSEAALILLPLWHHWYGNGRVVFGNPIETPRRSRLRRTDASLEDVLLLKVFWLSRFAEPKITAHMQRVKDS